jgi:hypothetical protein
MTAYMKTLGQPNHHFIKNILRVLARLSFEDSEALYSVLNELEVKLEFPNYKTQLLNIFYEFVKVKRSKKF